MASSAPNVLCIVTDQQRADHVGFMGNNVVRTPNLDALAARGMVMENAWVANPVCMPNRCSMMTGRLPTAHGVIFNDRTLDWQANTFVRRFAAHGYHTGLIGKSHLQHGMSKNSVRTYRGSPVQGSPYPAGWDEVEDFERYLHELPEMPADFYGFAHVELSIDHGARASGHHLQWALANGAQRDDMFVEYDAEAPGQHRSDDWWQIYQPPYASEFHSTEFVTRRTIDFIESARQQDRPWLTWCSFPDPHHPMTPPGDWFFRHTPRDMPLPASRHDALEDAPAHLRQFQKVHPSAQRDWVTPCGYGSDTLLQEALAATYGQIEMIDDGVGQIMSYLQANGMLDNTIVVFTSDHGDMMGDHGLMLKGFMNYRGVLQVPLVISTPDHTPGRSRELACSMDIGPTLMSLCEVSDYDGIQGVSLAPLLADPAAAVREHVLIEDDIQPLVADLSPIPAKTRTLITRTHRYTRNSKGEEQLFDLQNDPDEMHDLKKEDEALRLSHVEQLADALIAADDAARGAPAAA
ncbi:MAG: sulfatase-like hydrolase/transferase [Pseudomonadota bacterium]